MTGGDGKRLVADLARGVVGRAPGGHRLAAVEPADAERNRRRVARRDVHELAVAAQRPGDDVGEHGLDPLPHRGGAGGDRYGARRIDGDGSGFERPAPGALDEVGEPDAERPASCPGLPSPDGEPVPVRGIQRGPHAARIIA